MASFGPPTLAPSISSSSPESSSSRSRGRVRAKARAGVLAPVRAAYGSVVYHPSGGRSTSRRVPGSVPERPDKRGPEHTWPDGEVQVGDEDGRGRTAHTLLRIKRLGVRVPPSALTRSS